MRAKEYAVLRQAVEEGAAYGVRHFYKHRDDEPSGPEQEDLAAAVVDAVLSSIGDWFDFADGEAEAT